MSDPTESNLIKNGWNYAANVGIGGMTDARTERARTNAAGLAPDC